MGANKRINICILFFICITSCVNSQLKNEKDSSYPERINLNIDNGEINRIYEDTIHMRGRDICSMRHYKSVKEDGSFTDTKLFDKKPFRLDSYTEYLPDGRKLYKQYGPSSTKRIEKFHYDSTFQQLIVSEDIYDNERFYYYWLFYDEKSNLYEYLIYGVGKNGLLKYQAYTKYDITYGDSETKIDIRSYDSDTLMSPVKTCIFSYPYLTKDYPEFQSKFRKFEQINGTYKPIETKGFIFDERNVYFTYDSQGFITSEIWYKPENELENKTEYYYSNDYKERVEQEYHMQGTVKSTKTTRKYDQFNNLIFEQAIEFTGNPLSIYHYEYRYDEKGNWTDKKKYYQPCKEGVYGTKELVEQEIREIEYYKPNQAIKSYSLPAFPQEAKEMKIKIPRQAEEKQKIIDDFNTAVENGDFDDSIKTKVAEDLNDFTPKYWEVVGTALGDLDNEEGEEAAIVYKTPMASDIGFAHCLGIFKKKNGKWHLWHQTTSPLMDDRAGGMWGNPFDGIRIEKRAIVINHFGGSRQKWNYTHRYRFQNNNWYLIGTTVSFGAPCDYWESLDYNLVTGSALFKRTDESCDDNRKSRSWTKKINAKIPFPLMDEFTVGDNKIQITDDMDFYY